jgi:hypothetical protein
MSLPWQRLRVQVTKRGFARPPQDVMWICKEGVEGIAADGEIGIGMSD